MMGARVRTQRLAGGGIVLATLLAAVASPALAAAAASPPDLFSQLAPPPPRTFAGAAAAAPLAPSAPTAPPARQSPTAPAAPLAPAAAPAPASPAALAAAAGKTAILRGTLGGDQVQLSIRPKVPAEDGIEGSYFIFGGKQNILVVGEIDGENLWLEESENGVDVSGQWEGTRKGDAVEGTWQSPDSSMSKPFLLKIMPPAPAQP